jgi:hypothetical protein
LDPNGNTLGGGVKVGVGSIFGFIMANVRMTALLSEKQKNYFKFAILSE